jgi:hypothetical protein
LGEKFDEGKSVGAGNVLKDMPDPQTVKKMYAEANMALGDIIKWGIHTNSTKPPPTQGDTVVEDCRRLGPIHGPKQTQRTNAGGTGRGTLLPQVRCGIHAGLQTNIAANCPIPPPFKGLIGQPPYGFPEPLRTKILRGKPKIDGRPGKGMAPMDLDKKKMELEEKHGRQLRDVDVSDTLN